MIPQYSKKQRILNLTKNLPLKLILNPWKIDLIKAGKFKYVITALSRIYPIGVIKVNDYFSVKIKSRKLIKITLEHKFILMDEPQTILDKKDIIKFSGYSHFHELYKSISRSGCSMLYVLDNRWLYEIEAYELKVGKLI